MTATSLVAAACAHEARQQPWADADARRQQLRAALELRRVDPLAAAEALAAAGPGPELERLRLTTWVQCLELASAPPDAWRRIAVGDLPSGLAERARLGLARAELAGGRERLAAEIVADLPAPARASGLEALLAAGDPERRLSAAVQLATSDPARLRRTAPELERVVLAGLGPEGWLDRSATWRADGMPGRGAAELRGRRWRGEVERRRRMEIARCEVENGSGARALAALPAGGTEPEDRLLRARAHRLQGWEAFPRPAAGRHFGRCRDVARTAADATGDVPAWELVLECATEVGDLDAAGTAWARLAALGWTAPRRSWLGRRLGVALAAGGRHAEVARLAASLPEHRRCLLYWSAVSSTPADREALAGLADAGIGDLYAAAARRRLGIGAAPEPRLGDDGPTGEPPSSVAWLLGIGEDELALQQWRWMRGQRGATAGEALRAAELEAGRGHANEAIRWLREGFPDLGEVTMDRVPRTALEAYLPLPFAGAVRRAAREAGVPPWLVAGIARQESTFVPHARSPAGAVGVMQLLHGTARLHGRALGLGSRPDLRSPEVSLRLGAREVARLLERFGAVEPALAAYNAGPTRADRWWRRWPEPDVFAEAVPIPETYSYVRRVVFLAEGYRLVYDHLWKEPT